MSFLRNNLGDYSFIDTTCVFFDSDWLEFCGSVADCDKNIPLNLISKMASPFKSTSFTLITQCLIDDT